MKLDSVLELSCSEEKFWSLFMDAEVNSVIYCRDLGFTAFRVVSCEQSGDAVHRKLNLAPGLAVPNILKRVIGERLRYWEEGTFDRSRGTYEFTIGPAAGASWIDVAGTIFVRQGPNGPVRVATLKVSSRVPIVGAQLEAFVCHNLEEGLTRFAAALNARAERMQWADA
ncbi:MAG: DUF2505 domain-containing protein [Myxococcota bacterium]|nr:DUF2505 domain-containing protein [Myxococcota bacterium]